MSMSRKKRQKEEEGAGPAVPQERPAAESRRITPVEIQQVEFRRSLRGYNEREVDQFLDDVTEEMARLYAESKRRREEVEFKGTASLSTGPAAEADAMIRQAKGDAERILADARVRAQ